MIPWGVAMRVSEKEYLLSAIVAVTGFSPSTFNSMRRHNGFLGEREEKRCWARYSLVDICTAQVARDLMDKRISTQLSVDVANKLTARFECLEKEDTALEFYDNHMAVVTGPPRDSISLSFHNPTEAPLSSAVMAVIDLYGVFMRVLDALKELGVERVVDARRVVFGTLAKALAVESQEVVLGETESADWDFIIDAGVWPAPVVLMEPGGQISP